VASNVIPIGGGATPPTSASGSSSTGTGGTTTQGPWATTHEQTMRRIIGAIRQNKDVPRDLLPMHVYNRVFDLESRIGSTFIYANGKPYFLDGMSRRLFEIDPKNADFTGLLGSRYTLFSSDKLTHEVISRLDAFTREQGIRREIRRFAYYDTRKQVLYLSRYDGTCYRLDGTYGHGGGGHGFPIVNNGDGVLFYDDDRGVPCNPIISAHGKLLPTLIDDLQYAETTGGGLTPKSQRCLLAIWTFALAFPDLLPAKPLLLIEGQKGSGKTAAIQRIQLAIHGRAFPRSIGKHDEEGFGVTLLRSGPVTLIDNVDTYLEWFQDALCAYATGGGWKRRKKYSDSDEIEIHPQSFIALATRNPSTFQRDDVADRCLIIRLERRQDRANYLPLSMLMDQIHQHRAVLYGEWLYYLNEIVARLRARTVDAPVAHRLADFAHLAHVVAAVLNDETRAYTPALRNFASDYATLQEQFDAAPDDYTRHAVRLVMVQREIEHRAAEDTLLFNVEEMLHAAQEERDVLASENEPLIDVLFKWMDNTQNHGRAVRAVDLFRELAEIAQKEQWRFCKSVKALASKLRTTEGALARHFKVTRRDVHGGNTVYEFRRNEET